MTTTITLQQSQRALKLTLVPVILQPNPMQLNVVVVRAGDGGAVAMLVKLFAKG